MSLFDGLPEPQLRAALASAQAALIQLMSGNSIASVSYTQGDGAKSLTKRVTTGASSAYQRAGSVPGAARTWK